MEKDLLQGGALLPPPTSRSPSPRQQRPHLHRSWSSSVALSSSTSSRAKRQLYALFLALTCLALGVLWLSVSSYRQIVLGRAQHAARSAQSLQGFTESRLANIPDDLIPPRRLAEADLLLHPLLSAHTSPICALNMYQQDRYAPLEPSYGRGITTNQSTLPHFRPRHQLKYCESSARSKRRVTSSHSCPCSRRHQPLQFRGSSPHPHPRHLLGPHLPRPASLPHLHLRERLLGLDPRPPLPLRSNPRAHRHGLHH